MWPSDCGVDHQRHVKAAAHLGDGGARLDHAAVTGQRREVHLESFERTAISTGFNHCACRSYDRCDEHAAHEQGLLELGVGGSYQHVVHCLSTSARLLLND